MLLSDSAGFGMWQPDFVSWDMLCISLDVLVSLDSAPWCLEGRVAGPGSFQGPVVLGVAQTHEKQQFLLQGAYRW